MKRIITTIVLLAMLVVSVPASAATWRGLGTAIAVGNSATYDSASPGLNVMARDVKEVQIGVWQNSGSRRNFEIDYYISAYNAGGGSASKSGNPTKTVGNKTWTWFTVWNRTNSWDSVSVNAQVWRAGFNSHYQGLRTKVRVR